MVIDRSSCGFATFNECDPATCTRQCSATIYIPASDTPAGLHILAVNRWTLIGIVAVLSAVFFFAASVGLSREAQAYRAEARV